MGAGVAFMQKAIKPIETEEGYKAAMKRIQELYNQGPESDAASELPILTGLVEAYENRLLQQQTASK